jgi:hypothetical protein
MTNSSSRGWMRRTLLATAFVAAGAATLGSSTPPAQAQYYGYYGYATPYYAYYPYRPYYYGYPGVRVGWGWGRGGWGWGHWHHHW